MAIFRSSLVGSASIGVYSLVTEKMVIVPNTVPSTKAEKFGRWLKAELIHTTIGGSVLVGALACANSNGIVLTRFVREEELEAIHAGFDGKIAVMETKRTAYGNMILANDRGAIVDPSLKPSEIKKVAEALDVQTVPCEIAGLPYVGSLASVSNKGVLTHPLIKDSERAILEDVLSVPADLGTINCGIPYVGTGLIGNSRAVVVGLLTTGPEMFIIGHALDVAKEDE